MVGLGLLAVVERALLEGGPIGATDAAGAEGRVNQPRTRAGIPGKAPARRVPSRTPRRDAPVAAPDARTLTTQIRRLTLDERGAAARQAYGAAPAAQPLVGAARMSRDRTWAFGTTAIPVPEGSTATPEIAFFAARWNQGRWQAALSGTPAFGALIARMPPAVMSADEARVLARHSAVTAGQAGTAVNGTRIGDGLMLPWRVGATWSMGASAERGAARPLGTLAFWGGDGNVVAAGAGRLYRFCGVAPGRGMAMVVHRSGLATTYYRMRGVAQVRDGSVVSRGEPLGRTGTDRPCGGAPSPRPQVQFTLRRGAEEVPLDGAQLGGWTFRERAQPLLGYAERGVMQVLPGGLMANLGPVPAAESGPPLPVPGPSKAPAARPPGGGPAPSASQKRSSSEDPE